MAPATAARRRVSRLFKALVGSVIAEEVPTPTVLSTEISPWCAPTISLARQAEAGGRRLIKPARRISLKSAAAARGMPILVRAR